jgi:hypothetical protein
VLPRHFDHSPSQRVEARREIGLWKMMLGMDYPHPEGAWGQVSTSDYLQATLGAAQVPEDRARRLLGENAAEVFRFDRESSVRWSSRLAYVPKTS